MKRQYTATPVQASKTIKYKDGQDLRRLRNKLSEAFDALESCSDTVFELVDGEVMLDDLSLYLRQVDSALVGSEIDYN